MSFNPAGGAISGATDVAMNNPTNGHVLTYDGTIAKWENAPSTGGINNSSIAGFQIWNGTAWSARPSGFLYVIALSDGTAGSVRDSAAPSPTGGVDGDNWQKAV